MGSLSKIALSRNHGGQSVPLAVLGPWRNSRPARFGWRIPSLSQTERLPPRHRAMQGWQDAGNGAFRAPYRALTGGFILLQPVVAWSGSRKRQGDGKVRYRFEDYALDTDRRELSQGTDLVPLEPQVFDLLAYLIRNRDRVVSKDDLLAAIWEGRIVSESALTTRINAVRCAIGDSGGEQRLIKTLLRKGVRFVGAVREEPHAAESGTMDVSTPAIALPDRPSIAVLPFINMSSEPQKKYF